MLTPTNYTVDTSLYKEALTQLPTDKMKVTINKPTGNFFYDPWILKDEYKETVWKNLLDSLPVPKGEARIIILDPGHNYTAHADIDDRYHLNILGDESFLIDLMREQMHKLNQDGIWYDMNAGLLHTAANFGRLSRIQLVVRKLLKKNKLVDPVEVSLTTAMSNSGHARYLFDNTISIWLNEANKLGYVSNFCYSSPFVKFDIEHGKVESLKHMLPEEFQIL